MKRASRFLFSVCIFLLACIVLQSPFTVNAEVYPMKGRTMTVPKDLFGDEKPTTNPGTIVNLSGADVTLEGLVDSVELFYQVPLQGVKKGSSLNLNVQYSDLLLKGSTVTVLIDDKPVYSANLEEKTNEMAINIPLEGEAVTEGFHNVTISFYGTISKELCTNEENPANWLTIRANSHLFLNTKEIAERKNVLEDYPYPFIQNAHDEPVQSTIVIPDEASTSILNATVNLANYLSSQAANEDDEIAIIKESELETISSHLLAVGAEDQWTGTMKDIFKSAKLRVPEDELVVSNYYLKFPQASKQVMFLTAKSDKTIVEKIAVVTEESLIEQLAGDELSIANVPTIPKEEIKQKHKFSDLGIPSLSLTGKKEMSQSYFYQLPAYVDLQGDAELHLKLKVSDTLFQRKDFEGDKQEDAELVVHVNDVPHSVAVDDLDKKNVDSFYEVEVPIEAKMLRQETFLTIQFQAHGLSNREICVPPDDEKWIFIDEDSYLQVPTVETAQTANFRTWPAPFASINHLSETTILLPDAYDQTMISQLHVLTNNLGELATLDGLGLMFEKDASEEKLADRHVIVLGGLEDHPSLKEYDDQLLVSMDASGNLDLSTFEFLNETAKYVTWLQPSVWDPSKSMAVFSPVHPNDAGTFLSEDLLGYMNTNTIKTNIIVESANGEIFTHKLDDGKEAEEQPSIADEKLSGDENNWWLIGGFIGIFTISIVIFVYFYRKGKKRDK